MAAADGRPVEPPNPKTRAELAVYLDWLENVWLPSIHDPTRPPARPPRHLRLVPDDDTA